MFFKFNRDLKQNQLTGTLPDLTGLNNLEYYRLQSNYLSGLKPTLGVGLPKA